jgi:uncharacterized integral membrane protein
MATSNGDGVRYLGTGFYASVVASIAIAVAMLALAVQNTDPVTVKWFGFEFAAPLFAWVIGAALLAVIIDELVGLIWRARMRSRLTRAAQVRSPRAEVQRPGSPPAEANATAPRESVAS